MDDVLFRVLAARVGRYLDAVDRLVALAEEPAALAALRTEVYRLTAAWRVLLATHQRSTGGGCVGCGSTARPRGSFCVVWRTAHAYFVAGVPLPHYSVGETP